MSPAEIVARLRQQATTADAVGMAVLQWRANGWCLPHHDKRAAQATSEDAAEVAYTCRELAILIELGGLICGGT